MSHPNGLAQSGTRQRGQAPSIPASCVVYTPRPLADAIVTALGDRRRDTWLEPCVGGGVFIEALASLHVPRQRIRAIDLDPTPRQSDVKARTLRGREFLAWSQETRERFSRVVANPPFLALNRTPSSIRAAAMRIAIPAGRSVPLGSNCWMAFLCASVGLLEDGGSLGFVLPASWEYSDYAQPVRAVFPRIFREVQVHRCAQPLFSAVQEGSVVLVAREFFGVDKRRSRSAKANHVFHSEPEALIEALKTGRGPSSRRSSASSRIQSKSQTPSAARLAVRNVMEIRLGGVTGDAKYFVMSEDERCKHRIPVSACRPVISRAHHLTHGAITESDWERLRDTGERIWLFDPTPHQATDQSVAAYLRKRPSTGGCNRLAFKVRSRTPWYRTPMPTGMHGFMSGMSSWGPWVVFREMADLGATNTLYAVRFVDAKTRDAQAAWAMWLLTTRAQKRLRRIGRRYANGLLKFEPGDISALSIEKPAVSRGAFAAYKRAVRLLLKGKVSESRAIADRWFSLERP